MPLLQTLESLFCASDSNLAKQQLDRLFNISAPEQSWPDEWLGTQANQASLHAGTLDIALQILQQTAVRFPALRETAEQVALQWSYCEVLEEQQFYDLKLQAGKLTRTLAGEPPLRWGGFQSWGFLQSDPVDRFVPVLLDEIRIAPSAYHLFLHQIYRQQCFPHPETGLLAYEAIVPKAIALREAISWIPPQEQTLYPFTWQPACVATRTLKKQTLDTKLKRTTELPLVPERPVLSMLDQALSQVAERPVVPVTIINLEPSEESIPLLNFGIQPAQGARGGGGHTPQQKMAAVRKKNPKHSRKAALPKARGSAATPKPPLVELKTRSNALLSTKIEQDKRALLAGTEYLPKQRVATRSKPKPVKSATQTETFLPVAIEPFTHGKIPVYLEAENQAKQPQAHGTTGLLSEPHTQQKWQISSSLSNGLALKDASYTLGAGLVWSPQPNWFISSTLSLKEGDLGYAWSAGYADYKPGGWSAQLNNWGPIALDEGLALDKVVFNLGYRFKSKVLEEHKLAVASNLSLPIEGKSSLSATLQWNPDPNWSVRTTASLPLASGDLNWHYVLGYSNPALLGKWKFEYSNYGTNTFPGDNLQDGTLSIIRGWQF